VISVFPGLENGIIARNSLSNAIKIDGNGTGFTDFAYDVKLALQTTYQFAPGESYIVSTNTFFVTITPDALSLPESGSISGVKYEDLNCNSVHDFIEASIPDRESFLVMNRNGTFDTSEPMETTNLAGTYSFTDVLAGNYLVTAVRFASERSSGGTC
jgi:hypothetical protein